MWNRRARRAADYVRARLHMTSQAEHARTSLAGPLPVILTAFFLAPLTCTHACSHAPRVFAPECVRACVRARLCVCCARARLLGCARRRRAACAGAALAKRAALQDAMRQTAQEQGLDEVLLFVVDVLDESATFVSSSTRSAEMVGRAWGSAVGRSGTAKLPGVLSRKKQIVPALEAAADVAAERAEPAGSRRVQPAQMPRAAV
uniref:DHHA2 domain-containing protein n=1 Tax=Chrysotila carterae TaxID=13221 RepID=A0A6S9ZPR1_CHRCT